MAAAGGAGPRENVVVCVRVRPGADTTSWRLDTTQNSVTPTEQHPVLARRGGSGSVTAAAPSNDDEEPSSAYDFRFDSLVAGEAPTSALYRAHVLPVVRAAMDGYNGTVFAYGQTGSGKTHTMSGTRADPGVIPCAVRDVFAMIRDAPAHEFLLRVAYLEIYNETLRDLLAADDPKRRAPRIIEDRGRVVLAGMHEEIVTTPDDVLALLERGQASRAVGATDWNTRSSRSHCVFQITIEGRDASGEVRVSQLNLIDLAGSERAASEAARRKEGAYINKSLLTLGTVIAKLTEPGAGADAHIPYRDSKLTRLLQTSLSGDARVAVICTVSLGAAQAAETLSTLKFGRRCKLVVTKAQRHAAVDDKTLLEQYRHELHSLRARLGSGEASEENADDSSLRTEVAAMQEARADLRHQIDHLTRLILTSRSVAADAPARDVASPRRGPRMSDLPARGAALLLPSGAARSESADMDALRREIATLHDAQRAAREKHASEKRALENEIARLQAAASASARSAQGSERELVRLREEHAADEALREFRELVTREHSPEPGADAVHLQARIGALERALAEEKAMRDLSSLPERPRASPMQARGGQTPPCVPPRARSRSDSPAVEAGPSSPGASVAFATAELRRENEALRRGLCERDARIAELHACVDGWEARVLQQAERMARVLALVGGDEAAAAGAQVERRAGDRAPPRSRPSGIRPSDVLAGKARLGGGDAPRDKEPKRASVGRLRPELLPEPMRTAARPRSDATPELDSPEASSPESALDVPGGFPGESPELARDEKRAARPLPSTGARPSPMAVASMAAAATLAAPAAPAATASTTRPKGRALPASPPELLRASLSTESLPGVGSSVTGLGVSLPAPGTRDALVAPPALSTSRSDPSLAGEAGPGSPTHGAAQGTRGSPTRALPTPPSAAARLLPTPPAQARVVPSGSVAALRASLAAGAEVRRPRASVAVGPLKRGAPLPEPAPAKRPAPTDLPGGSHKVQARVSAYKAAAEAPAAAAAPSASVRGMPLKTLQSMGQLPTERRARDATILRELNELKAMPRVESSRGVYINAGMPSELSHARLPAAGYKTDASAYYI